MRTIAHISDLHFGRTNERAVGALVTTLDDLRPDLVVISGDLTQRARSQQFLQAREFVERLPFPVIVVPGNHDVPLYNLYKRFFDPLGKYKKFISNELNPCFLDDEIAVFGVNSARSLTFKGGAVDDEQAAAVCATLKELGNRIIKLIVTHHPLVSPGGVKSSDLAARAKEATAEFAKNGADIFLSGHLHVARSDTAIGRCAALGDYSVLAIQAGTAVSTRSRGETNSINLIEVGGCELALTGFEYREIAGAFAPSGRYNFTRGPNGWSRI